MIQKDSLVYAHNYLNEFKRNSGLEIMLKMEKI